MKKLILITVPVLCFINFLTAQYQTTTVAVIPFYDSDTKSANTDRSQNAVSELTEVLNSVLAGQGAKRSKMGGVRTAAEILNMMNSAEEETVVASLRERDNDLAQKIIDEMFVFDNLLDIEDRAIQLILKEIDNDTLMVALKGAQEELRAKFLRNMSSRAAEMLREDLEAQGPIRMSKVETEQKKILQIARRLAESGQIVLGNSGDDAYV